ncbi:pyroglutamyl-peptidase I [Sodalis ligni]|uniref:pyroglutamyl-peptidase I n=1 Tax=Sodalis ligni TaxID=2697027 RepID=UPI00193FE0B4|nr:pyroglutamyl-peptidase I [Sodalis ligni]QWA12583.1 pyroglutamyl-peptidase I [Sodalis ligni]
MKTVLLTGFEPFGGDSINPSWEVVRQYQYRRIDTADVVVCQLPCVFGRSAEVLNEAIDRYRPSLVLALGLAGGRQRISVERVAINVDDARIADNSQRQPIDRPVISSGPAAYFATVPIKAMVNAMLGAGIPAEVSQSAGTFVCNHVMYALLHRLAHMSGAVRGGFIHLPYLPQQAAALANAPSMARETMAAGLEIVIQTALTVEEDLHIAGGAVS